MSAIKPKPIKATIAILTGPERTQWPAPELLYAMIAWTTHPSFHDPGELRYIPAYGFKTSQHARNYIAGEFLKSTSDYLVMIDNDTLPICQGQVIDLARLLSDNLPIVGAPCPTMTGDDWLLNAYMLMPNHTYRSLTAEEWEGRAILDDKIRYAHQTPDGHLKVDAVGFGLVAIRRDVMIAMSKCALTFGNSIDKIIWWQPTDVDPEHYPPVFMRTRHADGSTAFGEDLLFCARAKVAYSYQTYAANPDLYTCGHSHTIDYGRIPQVRFAQNDPKKFKQKLNIPDNQELYACRGWEIEPELALMIQDDLSDATESMSIVELGMGFSTQVLLANSRVNKPHKVISIEHHKETYEETVRVMGEYGLWDVGFRDHWRPMHCDLVEAGRFAGFYDLTDRNLPTFIDYLLIDGPPGSYNSRRHALDRLGHYLVDGATVILDDVNRPDEAAAWGNWVNRGLIYTKSIKRVGRAVVGNFNAQIWHATQIRETKSLKT